MQSKGIQKSLATFLKADVDVDAFVTAFNASMKEVTKTTGYVPDSHNAGDKITAEEFRNWSYDQRAELYTKNPTLYQKLVKQLR